MQQLSVLDYSVFFVYFIIVATYGYWIYNRKKQLHTDSKDFFLAEGSLTWWAIGSSLIASNISAEQMIGMSGNGFKMGLAIAAYEWMAAATLIVVAVFFLPIYLQNKIYTMPQFLRQRYNSTVSMIMAIFWLSLYVVVNLTSILFLGALAVSTISGLNFTLCMIFLSGFATTTTVAAAPSTPTTASNDNNNNNNMCPTTTGRWTNAEHQAFLDGLRECGREWKKVALKIPTRSSAQIRSHAQKYFAKLAREEAAAAAAQAQAAAAAAAANAAGTTQHGQLEQYSPFFMSTSSVHHNHHSDDFVAGAASGRNHGPTAQRILANPQSAKREVEDTLEALRERYRKLQLRLDRRRRRRQEQRHRNRNRRHHRHHHGNNPHDGEETLSDTDDDSNSSSHFERRIPPQTQPLPSSNNDNNDNNSSNSLDRSPKHTGSPRPPVLAIATTNNNSAGSAIHGSDENSSVSSNLSSVASRRDLGNEEMIALQVLGGDLSRADTHSSAEGGGSGRGDVLGTARSSPPGGQDGQAHEKHDDDAPLVPSEVAVVPMQHHEQQQQPETCNEMDISKSNLSKDKQQDGNPQSTSSP